MSWLIGSMQPCQFRGCGFELTSLTFSHQIWCENPKSEKATQITSYMELWFVYKALSFVYLALSLSLPPDKYLSGGVDKWKGGVDKWKCLASKWKFNVDGCKQTCLPNQNGCQSHWTKVSLGYKKPQNAVNGNYCKAFPLSTCTALLTS